MSEHAVLQLSNWNHADIYYEADVELIIEFGRKIKSVGFPEAWDWWCGQVDYDEDGKLPIKTGIVDMRLPVFFLDYDNQSECLAEWDSMA